MENTRVLLPVEVDIDKCISLNSAWKGARLDSERLTRLKESCVSIEGDVTATVTFETDANGMRMIKGICEADLTLVCQRCGENYVQHLQSKINFTPDYDKAKACNIENRYDFVEPGENGLINIYDLIEDGLILEIPTVPKHDEDDPQCSRHGDQWEYGELAKEATASPFAALAALKDSLGAKENK